MKKALVLLLALALVGGLVFAQDIVYKTAPTVSGYGQVTWGVNFNDSSTGFVNAAEAKMNVPLVSKQTVKHTGDAIYGEVTIADLELDLGTDATTALGSVTAKVLLPSNLYVQVYGAPGFGLNWAKSAKTYVNDGWDDNRGLVKGAGWTGNTGGITIGMTGDFNFALKVASVGAYNTAKAAVAGAGASAAVFVATGTETDATNIYTVAGAAAVLPLTANAAYIRVTPAGAGTAAVPNNIDNIYGVGGEVSYKVVDLLTATLGFAYGPFGDTASTGLAVKVNVAPKDTGITANAAMDLGINGAGATDITGMDISADVAYTLANVVSASASVYFGDADLELDTTEQRLDAGVRVALLAVPNLSADVGVDLWSLMADPAMDPMQMFLGSNVSYKIMQGDVNYFKPYATLGYALSSGNDALDTDDGNLYIKLGVEAVLFPNGVLTAQYVGGSNVGNNSVTKAIVPGASATNDDKGTFTLSCKVSY